MRNGFRWAIAASAAMALVFAAVGVAWAGGGGKKTIHVIEHAKTDTVKANRVRLVNLDEAALKVASRQGTRHIPVGKSTVVPRGNYVIMMVKQAPDDNYLKLTVR